MKDYYSTIVATMDTNDLFIFLGFCPDVVKLTKLSDGQDNYWYRIAGNDSSISRVAAGDRTVNTDKGIKLVKFEVNSVFDQTSDPTVVTPNEYVDANGIQLTSDIAFLADDNLVFVEAWRMNHVFLKATHDGGDAVHTYMQDSSEDFKKAGVSGNQTWLIYNQTNGDYAYVGEVLKPSGQTKFCRLTVTDADGNALAAADFDDDDVCYVFPKAAAWYPLSDITIMT